MAQPNGCSFPVVLSRVFFPRCSFPGVPSWVFFPRCFFHSPTGVLSRESHPQSGSREPSTFPQSTHVLLCALCGTSVAPSVARHLRPLWHVICARCGTSFVPSVGSLAPPGLLLEPPGPLLTHLYTVYMACSECLLTRLNPLAERTCFSQVGPVVGSALSARDMRLPYAILPPLGHTRLDSRPKQLRPCTKKRTAVDSAIRADIGDLPFLGVLMSIVSLCYLVSHVRPCGGLYCPPFSNEGLDGISETPTHSTICSGVAYEPNPTSHCDLLSTQYHGV